MKFGVKHALVVAVCALCVCVVATGTVVAVTMNSRTAEAATRTVPVVVINHAGVTLGSYAAMVNWADGSSGLATNGITLGAWNTIGLALPPSQITPMGLTDRGVNVMPPTLTVTGGTGHIQSSAGMQIIWTPEGLTAHGLGPIQGNHFSLFVPNDARITNITIRMREHFWELPTQGMSLHRIVRRNNTGGAIDTITRVQGLHGVSTGVGTPIPNPTTPANFRGWSYRVGGAVIWPVGLPMYVVSDMRIYAIHG